MTYIILLTRRVGVKVLNLFVECNHGKSCGCYGTNLSYGYQIYWIQTFMILQIFQTQFEVIFAHSTVLSKEQSNKLCFCCFVNDLNTKSQFLVKEIYKYET
jgi:hypothetical protein